MKALHVNWTKPSVHGGTEYYTEDFDILTTVLSALKWREKNGTIKMVTDSTGLDYYKSRDMLSLWDETDTSLDDMPHSINPDVFWAAGKLYAAKTNGAPFAMIDTDFIVWDRIAFNNIEDLAVIHDEELSEDIYPNIHYFKMKYGYIFDPNLDWREKPFNTAFYIMKSPELLNEYTSQAFSFMENTDGDDYLRYMVFAEQRLLAMTAKKMNSKVKILSDLERLFKDGENYFTHIWGMKQQMRDIEQLRYDFCRKCVKRIKRDFPEYIDMLKRIRETEKYLR